MRALLDVNVLIALLDADHVSHRTATTWFSAHAHHGWASCAITQNGCVRIMASPAYPNALPVHAVTHRLAEATASDLHEFWPANISWLDATRIDATRVHGPRQLTDIYLLALAVAHDGRLVTFDNRIAVDAVAGVGKEHLLSL